MAALAEVVEHRPLDDLATRANAELRAVQASELTALEHALRCGEALLHARMQVPEGEWVRWLIENFEGSDWAARKYMRLAENRDEVAGCVSIKDAYERLRGRTAYGVKYPESVKKEARQLREKGLTYAQIADELGVYRKTVSDWLNRQELEKRVAAVKAEERAHAIRQIGGGKAEMYSLVRKLEQLADRELPEVLGLCYELDDAIVRALGVE